MSEFKTILCFPKGQDKQLSENFWLREMHCKCSSKDCRITLVCLEGIEELQKIRDLIGPLKISSAFRCGPHNRTEGGGEHSMHLFGLAWDVIPIVAPISALKEQAEGYSLFRKGGIGTYRTWLHLDLRPWPARWVG